MAWHHHGSDIPISPRAILLHSYTRGDRIMIKTVHLISARTSQERIKVNTKAKE